MSTNTFSSTTQETSTATTSPRPFIFIDSSDPIHPNQVIKHTESTPIIKLPFPPLIDPHEIIMKKSRGQTTSSKPPNAFIIYRRKFVETAHSIGYKIPMTVVSTMASQSWDLEPANVKNEYKRIAKEAKDLYYKLYPKATPAKAPKRWRAFLKGEEKLGRREKNNSGVDTSSTNNNDNANTYNHMVHVNPSLPPSPSTTPIATPLPSTDFSSINISPDALSESCFNYPSSSQFDIFSLSCLPTYPDISTAPDSINNIGISPVTSFMSPDETPDLYVPDIIDNTTYTNFDYENANLGGEDVGDTMQFLLLLDEMLPIQVPNQDGYEREVEGVYF